MKIPPKYEKAISGFYQDEDGYWVQLKEEFTWGVDHNHVIHEDTFERLLEALKDINELVPVRKRLSLAEAEKWMESHGFEKKVHKDGFTYNFAANMIVLPFANGRELVRYVRFQMEKEKRATESGTQLEFDEDYDN